MKCDYQVVCAFYHRRIPIHDVMYRTNVERYCEGNSTDCAICQVLKKSNFLKVHGDLYPNQTFRVDGILKS